jgi:hypothetical protein
MLKTQTQMMSSPKPTSSSKQLPYRALRLVWLLGIRKHSQGFIIFTTAHSGDADDVRRTSSLSEGTTVFIDNTPSNMDESTFLNEFRALGVEFKAITLPPTYMTGNTSFIFGIGGAGEDTEHVRTCLCSILVVLTPTA